MTYWAGNFLKSLAQIDLPLAVKFDYVLDVHVQYVLFIIRIRIVFSRVKKDPLLVFSSSKTEFQLPIKSEEAGYEYAICFQLTHPG